MRYRVDDKWVSRDKDYGKAVTAEGMKDALAEFFNSGSAGLRRDVLATYVAQLQHLYDLFSSQRELRFYSSSLLFVYDADQATGKALSFVHFL